MSAPDTEPKGFLSRWSQRKQALARGEAPPEPPAPVAPAAAAPAGTAEPEAPLPDPATLTLADDFSAFLRPKVSAALKQQAMKQLFAQAHFNQVDMLDVYMDDYNLIPDLPAAELDLMQHARKILNPEPAPTLAELDEAREAALRVEAEAAEADDAATAPGEAADTDPPPQPD